MFAQGQAGVRDGGWSSDKADWKPGLAITRRCGLQGHAHLDSEHPDVRGAVVAAGIDNVLKIRLNVCPAKDVERVENFL